MDEDIHPDGNNDFNVRSPTTGKLLNNEVNKKMIPDPTWKDVSNQILASCIAALNVIHVGLNMSFSAVLLPVLEDPNSDFKITKSQSSWIASLLVLVVPIGSLLSGPISDKFGRKKAFLMSCVPTIAAWTITTLTPTSAVHWLYLARTLGGLGGGMTTTFIVYVSEICNEKYRAMLLSLNSVAVALGILIVTMNAVHMTWRMMATCYAILALITLFLIWIITPESPHWLLLMSKKSNARVLTERSLQWLNPKEEIYERALNQMLTANRQADEIEQVNKKLMTKIKQSILYLKSPNIRSPFLILMGLLMLQQLSGSYAIIFYTIHIFKKFRGHNGKGIDEYSALLLLGILRFIASIIASGLARVVGRKKLLYVSLFWVAVSCITISIYQFYLQVKVNETIPLLVSYTQNETNATIPNDINAPSNWLPVTCCLIIVSAGSIGLLNIPWTLIGELLPTSMRGCGTGFMISFTYIILFLVIKCYPYLLDLFNIGYVFLIQGMICLITIVYVFLFVPETLGKSLHEIEEYFLR